jgi:hypothetical protein
MSKAAWDKKKGDQIMQQVQWNCCSLTNVNAYTQYRLGSRNGQNGQMSLQVDYDAIRLVFRNIKNQFAGKKLAHPKIGAGLASGDWDIIARIIDEELNAEDHTVAIYQP